MTKFLVTGGAGFIGSHIATALAERGDKVTVLDNLSTGHLHNLAHLEGKITFLKGDIQDRKTVEQALDGVDVVYHEAALASVPRSVAAPLDTNAACVTGTLNLLDAARQAGVRRVVYAGSSSAYGDQPFASKREADLPIPLSPYAAAKLAGESYCRAFTSTYGLETVVIRYFNVFGPRQDPNSEYSAVIPKFVTAMLAGKQPTIYGDGLQSRDFTFVDNVVLGNLLAAEAPGASGQVLERRMRWPIQSAPTARRDQHGAGDQGRADLRGAAPGRRAGEPGRHHVRTRGTGLRAEGRFSRRAAPVDRLLSYAGRVVPFFRADHSIRVRFIAPHVPSGVGDNAAAS